ncbi:condensation domain-containing protein [Streptomyces aidingensis]|uniref:HxxPF-repeated domain-containing protein n=1 Tax=Streptomyces aidingensis TaxID=910347 RepID=A0A1I1KBS1_9ACTN|nr:condensation domain-containing protein [Streptomyces aidingensis]SFC57945.1 HxxPF-repeated domain-containing protein [Streptomyces aidingensis]
MARSTVPTGNDCALSIGQEALWFLHALAPGSSAYNIAGAVTLDFDVDVAALEAAVLATVSGNSMLNCLFRSTRAGPRRLPGAAAPYSSVFEVIRADGDAAAHPPHPAALEASRRPFRLEDEAPVRVSLVRPDTGRDVLVVTAHHIALDNVSHFRLCGELLAAYARRDGDTGAGGAGRPDQGAGYPAFVRQEQDFLRSPQGEAARRHWRQVLQAVPHDPPLTGDLPRPAGYRFTGDQIELPVPAGLLDRAAALAAGARTTPFAVLFAVFQLLLYSLSGERLRLMGYPVTVRPGAEHRTATGYYVNTLPFAARVEPDESFLELLRRTGVELLSGLVHRAYPFALMPHLAGRPREADRAGLISVLFVMTEEDVRELDRALPPGHRVRMYPLPQQQGQFDLTLQLARRGPDTAVILKYNTSLYTPGAARAVAERYLRLLTAAAGGTLPARLGELAPAPARAPENLKN